MKALFFFSKENLCCVISSQGPESSLYPHCPRAAWKSWLQGFPQYIDIMRESSAETLQRIKWGRESLPGNHSRSMDIVLISQGLRPAQDTLGAGRGPEPASSQALLTAALQGREPGRGCSVSSPLLREPGQGGWRAAGMCAWGTSWLLFLSFSQVLCLPWEM